MKKFRFPTRTIVSQLWGEINGSEKTKRPYVKQYFCCSHGGIVVPAEKLKKEEIESLNKAGLKSQYIYVAYQGDRYMGYHSPFSNKRKGIEYFPSLGPMRWEKYDIFIFEEDDDMWIANQILNFF